MYERVAVGLAPQEAVEALRRELGKRGITEYAVVDHGHDMAQAGAPLYTAWTLIFGNPAAGARLLAADPAAAVDIPLRIAVIPGKPATELIFRPGRPSSRPPTSTMQACSCSAPTGRADSPTC